MISTSDSKEASSPQINSTYQPMNLCTATNTTVIVSPLFLLLLCSQQSLSMGEVDGGENETSKGAKEALSNQEGLYTCAPESLVFMYTSKTST